eukprot:3593697-Amphidinium_carterae.2
MSWPEYDTRLQALRRAHPRQRPDQLTSLTDSLLLGELAQRSNTSIKCRPFGRQQYAAKDAIEMEKHQTAHDCAAPSWTLPHIWIKEACH